MLCVSAGMIDDVIDRDGVCCCCCRCEGGDKDEDDDEGSSLLAFLFPCGCCLFGAVALLY